MGRIKQWRELLQSNTKVIENYSFMTFLQLGISLFGVLVYPYLIRVLKADSYGLYVFSLSVASYFVNFISFGFSFPAVRDIALNLEDSHLKSNIFSKVFWSKSLLALVSLPFFIALLYSIPIMSQHKWLFVLSYLQVFGEILFPVWYYQAIQKMKVVTFIQLSLRLLSLPLIFIFIKNPSDTSPYALIISSIVVLSAFGTHLYLIRRERLQLHYISFQEIKAYFKEALPFFWTVAASAFKQESITILIGTFLGMREVALYDLANKIILLPRMVTMNINKSIFPKVILDARIEMIRWIMKLEAAIGIFIMLLVTITGYWLVIVFGGHSMIGAYPLAILLSTTIFSWLIVGCYNNFIFIPNDKSYFVARNELFAMITFFLIALPGIFIFRNIYSIIIALALSSFFEIIYCHRLSKEAGLWR